jgi:hypothetical protein
VACTTFHEQGFVVAITLVSPLLAVVIRLGDVAFDSFRGPAYHGLHDPV